MRSNNRLYGNLKHDRVGVSLSGTEVSSNGTPEMKANIKMTDLEIIHICMVDEGV